MKIAILPLDGTIIQGSGNNWNTKGKEVRMPMNIEAYDIDSLRKLVRSLQNENIVLKAQLRKVNISGDYARDFLVFTILFNVGINYGKLVPK